MEFRLQVLNSFNLVGYAYCIYNPIIGPSYSFVYTHWMGLIPQCYSYTDGILNNENDLSLVFCKQVSHWNCDLQIILLFRALSVLLIPNFLQYGQRKKCPYSDFTFSIGFYFLVLAFTQE